MSEISWPPVGIVFSFKQDKRFEIMENITNWDQYKFKNKKDFLIKLPKLQVNSHYPLSFGTLQEIEQEQNRCLPMYLFHVPENSQSLTNIGVLWKNQK